MVAKSIDLQAPPADLLRQLQANQNGANQMGAITTAAMLAAAEGSCDCETCQLMRRMSKQLRASILEG